MLLLTKSSGSRLSDMESIERLCSEPFNELVQLLIDGSETAAMVLPSPRFASKLASEASRSTHTAAVAAGYSHTHSTLALRRGFHNVSRSSSRRAEYTHAEVVCAHASR
ncbi:hypothetical protein BV898_06979 [Hypsibius exemplaris]|uniref:Uncharacterized protein n=1 Tax=Hypsibius exemplaris TaxID=2072580 RepID=A0A1W0WUN0_HYPEX|nr:hypothetical protein BV898_06979 [Hypsibius exemplaris]